MNFSRIDQVAQWRLCMGCGACASVCPERNIELVDIENIGIRPLLQQSDCRQCGQCVQVCPGIQLEHRPLEADCIDSLGSSWGPVLSVWEGYATDTQIRFQGSSGGVATALGLSCIEHQNVEGVIQVGPDKDKPWINRTYLNATKQDMLDCAGSRYSPAAPCGRFDLIENAQAPCVFIGKPCDVAALKKAMQINPVLKEKTLLTISIFCAGTPTTAGTNQIMKSFNLTPDHVASFRYRGHGWPGMTCVTVKGDNGRTYEMSYEQSWGTILSKHCQLRCRLCPDGTGEFADIACGDPWYKPVDPENPGESLVLVRTEKGREILTEAMRKGYVHLTEAPAEIVAESQKSLLHKRRSLWGRIAAMRMLGIPAPRYIGFRLFQNWRQLSCADKLRSFFGTLRRALSRC